MRQEFGPAWWQLVLVVLGVVAFVIGGIWMMVEGDLAQKAGGLLAVAFFGGGALYTLLKGRRGRLTFAVVDGGIETNLGGMAPRFIPWTDIEGFGTATVSSQHFTTIRLNSYATVLRDITAGEARAVVRLANNFRRLGQAVVVIGALNDQYDPDAQCVIGGMGHADSVADVLAGNRRQFGGEFLLGWSLRNRSASRFAAYLEELRTRTQNQAPRSSN